MTRFIIQRTHPGPRLYVAPSGSPRAYVSRAKARRFDTREQAQAELCVENEIILETDT